MRLSNHLIFYHSLLLFPSIFPSIRVFSNESALCIRWPKFWSFSFSNPFNEYSVLISFRIDCFDLLAIQGTLKSSPASQLESINSSALSLLYGPVLTFTPAYWKNHSFDYTTCVHKVTSLFFNRLSRFAVTFLPKSKHLLSSCLELSSSMILEPRKIKSITASTFPPTICREMMGPDAKILAFWMLSFKPAFSLSSFTFIKRLLVPLHFLPLEWYYLHSWGCWHFSCQSWFQLVIYSAWHFVWWALHVS